MAADLDYVIKPHLFSVTQKLSDECSPTQINRAWFRVTQTALCDTKQTIY